MKIPMTSPDWVEYLTTTKRDEMIHDMLRFREDPQQFPWHHVARTTNDDLDIRGKWWACQAIDVVRAARDIGLEEDLDLSDLWTKKLLEKQ